MTRRTLVAGYGDRVILQALDLTVPPSKIMAVLSANACGNPTLLIGPTVAGVAGREIRASNASEGAGAHPWPAAAIAHRAHRARRDRRGRIWSGADELSCDQRQCVWIAMVLAQQTDLLLLDKPPAFQDISHQGRYG